MRAYVNSQSDCKISTPVHPQDIGYNTVRCVGTWTYVDIRVLFQHRLRAMEWAWLGGRTAPHRRYCLVHSHHAGTPCGSATLSLSLSTWKAASTSSIPACPSVLSILKYYGAHISKPFSLLYSALISQRVGKSCAVVSSYVYTIQAC